MLSHANKTEQDCIQFLNKMLGDFLIAYIPDSFVNLNKRNGEQACVTRQTILIVNYQKKAEDEQH
jgi:hypothetical protein